MTEYISREAVLQDLCGHCISQRYCDKTGDRCYQYGGITILPAADVAPVVHAEWKENDNGTWSCSRCSSWLPNEQHHYARFCLHCGAMMAGGKNAT